MPLELRTSTDAVIIGVRVKPRASRSRVIGEKEGLLEVAVAAPPVDGAANAELLATLARCFSIPRSRVTVIAGDTSRLKRVSLRGITVAEVMAALR